MTIDPASSDKPSSFDFLRAAVKGVPAVKYALGVGGIFAVVAIVASFRLDPRFAIVGGVVMPVLMVVLVLFARFAGQRTDLLRRQLMVLSWFCVLLFMATAVALFSSMFFGKPLDWRNGVANVSIEKGNNSVPTFPKPKDGTKDESPDKPVLIPPKNSRTSEVPAKVKPPGEARFDKSAKQEQSNLPPDTTTEHNKVIPRVHVDVQHHAPKDAATGIVQRTMEPPAPSLNTGDIKQGPCSVTQVGGQGNQATTNCMNVRSLSVQERTELIQNLKTGLPGHATVWAVETGQDLGVELYDALKAAGW